MFNIKIKFEGRTVLDEKRNSIKDFDPIMDDLKKKFGDRGVKK